MRITKHSFVAIEYRLTDEDGEELDNSGDDGPLTYVHGMQEIIPGLERALEGHSAGDQFQATIEPADAYGERYEELCLELSRDEFEDSAELELGMQFSLTDEDEEETVVTVVDFDDDVVVVDGNHPLAGETLHFDVKVHDVRPATAEEIEQSASHACETDCGCDHDDED
ncbi:MAG: peptidylprolyl isomerase [Bythopirellula sp.]|nr:peptidylprolyl isomerase [Bythopirellula sp.]